MHVERLKKPDGRSLILYGETAWAATPTVPAPPGAIPPARPELRWHPLRGEWVAFAGHREERTFQPTAAANPLAPTRDPLQPTELPSGNWDMAVFENRFPAFVDAPPAADPGTDPPRAARGVCEVVVYTQDPAVHLGTLPVAQVDLLLAVWAHRTAELGARDVIQYVMPFENRGPEAGATLPHPHGQIYAYPFVPPVAARELQLQGEHHAATGKSLLGDIVAGEVRDGRRRLYDDGTTAAFVPAFARYPYEVWVAPHRAIARLDELDPPERRSLAHGLSDVLQRLDGLWGRPMPYVLVVHQAPTDGRAHPEAHLHLEFYPALRSRDRLKILAGTELGAGTFTNDSLPERRAAELQAVPTATAPAS